MKQMEVTEKRIGENVFYIKPFPAFTSANLSGELAALLAPMLGSLAPLFGTNDGNIMDVDVSEAMPSLTQAFSVLSGDKFERIMKRLLVDSKNISFSGEITDNEVKLLTYDLANEVFCGEIQEMYMLCFEVIKLNFGGFFKKLGTQSGNLQDIVQKVIPGPNNTENSTPTDSVN